MGRDPRTEQNTDHDECNGKAQIAARMLNPGDRGVGDRHRRHEGKTDEESCRCVAVDGPGHDMTGREHQQGRTEPHGNERRPQDERMTGNEAELTDVGQEGGREEHDGQEKQRQGERHIAECGRLPLPMAQGESGAGQHAANT